MNIQIEAIIFDWAGTTIDFGSMAPIQAFMEAFADFNLEVTLAETRKPMGMSKRDHIITMLDIYRIHKRFKQYYHRDFTQEDIDTIYNLFQIKLMNSLSLYTVPKPFVLDTINKLRDLGIKIGSTTGYNQKMMDVVVPHAATKGYLPDCWVCSDDVGGLGRPYPYMLFSAMQKLQVSHVKNVIKIGDTCYDIKEGLAAGVWSVGVIEGSSEMGLSEDEYNKLSVSEQLAIKDVTGKAFKSYGADFVIDNISQIFNVINMIENNKI